MPQNMKPKKLSNSELMRDNRSLKNGITSAMIKANTHVTARIAAHPAQPATVLLVIWRLPAYKRKKTKRALTEA